MICLSLWYQDQEVRAVKTAPPPPPMIWKALRGKLPRNVGSFLLREVGFGVTVWNSDFGGGGGVSSLRGPLHLFGQVQGIFWKVRGMCLKVWRGNGNEILYVYVLRF